MLFRSGRRELIATTCWYIWWERRRIDHDEAVQKPARSAQAIAALALNYYRALKKNTVPRKQGWDAPKEGYVKLNVDASFSLETLKGSSGSVIRDDHGVFIAASHCPIDEATNAGMAEARALRDGLLLAGQVGCNKVEINSDCLEVIDVMKEGGISFGDRKSTRLNSSHPV